jgi:hypothetical protein
MPLLRRLDPAFQADAAFMKRQPGFISAQLDRAIGESATYLNRAVWESTVTLGLRSGVLSSERTCRHIRPRPSLSPVPEGRGTRRLRRVGSRTSVRIGRSAMARRSTHGLCTVSSHSESVVLSLILTSPRALVLPALWTNPQKR